MRTNFSLLRLSPTMGAWGLASDENDWTYDDLGMSIKERMTGVALTDKGKENIWNDLRHDFGDGTTGPLGVIVFLVKVGALLPVTVIEASVESLEAEVPGTFFPNDAVRRAEVVQDEIKLLKMAIEGGGQTEAIGANPIFRGTK